MYALLDAVGAFMAGGAILLTLFTALLNIQGHAFNTTMQVTNNQAAERVTSVLEDYLSYVASGSDIDPSTAITQAEIRTFSFTGKIQNTLATHNYIVMQGAQDGTTGWWPIQIFEDGTQILGDMWADEEFEFLYYDEEGNQIPFIGFGQMHSSNLPLIRSMSVKMSLVSRGWAHGTDVTNVHNNIVFWKFFKNMYMQ